MTRVLVTGGGGFLGSRAVDALAEREDVELVVSADLRLPDPTRRGRTGVEHAVCDVTDRDAIAPLLTQYGIDTVVHLAAIVAPGRDEALERRVDVDGSRNVIDACIATGVRRLVVSSSGAAYGYHPDAPDWLHEDDPIRGNEEFSYSRHKRIVEELLADARRDHPELEQVVFRIGTILGETVRNDITALWDGKRILRVRGSASPFVFVWVDDVAAALARAATDGPPGIYNVAGDGRLTVDEIAARLGKPLLTLPAGVLAAALAVGRALRLTPHGPAQVRFLRYRPVLANDRLKHTFGFTPAKTSAQAFDAYVASHPHLSGRTRR